MTLVLTCLLCSAVPSPLPLGATDRLFVHGERLTLAEDATPQVIGPLPLALGHLADQGGGDGNHGDHSGHVGPMWILMGAMMVVMMVGMAFYLARNAEAGRALEQTSVASPAQLAVPVSIARGAGG